MDDLAKRTARAGIRPTSAPVQGTISPIAALHLQARNRPEDTVIVWCGETWTYRRLAYEVERLAAALFACGLRQGDRVALHMTNRPELIIAYHACFRLGAIASPLSTRLKTPELGSLLQRLRPAFFLGQDQLYPEIASIAPDIVATKGRFVVGSIKDERVQPWEALFKIMADPPPVHGEDARAPAILLTTSGMTGQPKFVTHTAATLAAAAEVFRHLHVDREQTAVLAVPLVHSAGLMTALACIRFGARIVLVDRFDPDAVLDAVACHHATWMLGAPFMFAEMVARQRSRARDVVSLWYCVSAGDVCPTELQRTFAAVFGTRLSSLWGSTEVMAFLHGLQPGAVCRVPPGAQVRLVDERGMPVPQGEVGEMLVKGPTVTPGYWISPDRMERPSADGWFRTGDLMRHGGGDDLWFVARTNELIVRCGSTVSPLEVEAVLHAHAAVRDAAVVGVPDEILGQRVVAAVELVAGAADDASDDILALARTQLVDDKIPDRLIIVDRIPRNALGKVDRGALRDLIAGA